MLRDGCVGKLHGRKRRTLVMDLRSSLEKAAVLAVAASALGSATPVVISMKNDWKHVVAFEK